MLADLLSESYDADLKESRENERTATPVRAFAVRLHQTGCLLQETTAILAELGVAEVECTSPNAYGIEPCLVTSFRRVFTGRADTKKVRIDSQDFCQTYTIPKNLC